MPPKTEIMIKGAWHHPKFVEKSRVPGTTRIVSKEIQVFRLFIFYEKSGKKWGFSGA